MLLAQFFAKKKNRKENAIHFCFAQSTKKKVGNWLDQDQTNARVFFIAKDNINILKIENQKKRLPLGA